MKAFYRAFLISAVILFCGVTANAQSVCTAPVYDGAGVLGGQTADVQAAISKLDAAGADAHAITYSGLTGATLDQTVMNTVKSCPAMQSPNGGVKTTLVIIAVAPHAHKLGIFAGHAFDGAFPASDMNRYRTQFMVPHFRAGEWAQGLAAPADQMAQRLTAYTSEANAPVTNTVVNQASAPTDYHGLWVFLWLLGALGFLGIGLLVFFRLRKAQEERTNAQATAVATRNSAAQLVTELTTALSAADATLPGVKAAQSVFDTYSASYTRLAGTLSGDPSDNTLTTSAYNALDQQYGVIVANLQRAQHYLDNPTIVTPPLSEHFRQEIRRPSGDSTVAAAAAAAGASSGSSPAPTPTVVNNTTVVQDDSGSGFVTGLVVGDMISSQPTPPPASYPTPAPDDDNSGFSAGSGSSNDDSGSSSSSDDDNGGFSSDSGSSDWSDSSSSSSDWGGGSSDFGGGDSGGFDSGSGSDSF